MKLDRKEKKREKGKRWSPSPIRLAQTSGARLPLELNPMLEGIKTFTTFFHQLHCWLEILEMDTSTNMFSDGTHLHSLGEVTKNQCFHDTSFFVQDRFFPLPIKVDTKIIGPLVISSFKSLEDHLLHFRDFA